MKARIGVDVGGTNIVCGVVSPDGKLLSKLKKPTEARLGDRHVIDRIAEMAREAAASAGIPLAEVEAVGVGTPGLVDPERGVSIGATNLGWADVPVARRLTELLDRPVFIDNDVRMYVLGEALRGAGQGYRNVLGVTIGTGLAAAYVSDGRLFYGGGYLAGELGHIVFDDIPYACGCGLHGCLETVVSATGVVRQTLARLARGETSTLSSADPAALTAADVAAACEAGDALAFSVLADTGRWLGKGLAHAVTLYSPDIVIIGGGVAAAAERILGPMREEMRKRLLPALWERIVISLAALPDDAGVIGSALHASPTRTR